MAAFRPELTTKEQVLNFYENSKLVRFKVFAGTKPEPMGLRYEYDGDNVNEGLAILSEALDGLLANPMNINTYVLQLIRSDRVIRTGEHKAAKKLQDAVNITFQLNFGGSPYAHLQPQQNTMAGNSDGKIVMLLEKMIEQQNILLSNLAAAKEIEEEEEEEEELPLIGLLKNERVQNLLIDKIVGMFDNKPKAMAGVPNDKIEINAILERLAKLTPTVNEDLLKLVEIGEKNKALFDVLLNQLRAM